MAKINGNNLPAYTTVDNIILFLDTLKRKKKEDEVKAIFGKGGSAYTNTKSALRIFGFIENDSLEFTEKGRKVAYSKDEDKKNEMVKLIVSYPPYEVFLLSLLQRESFVTTEVEEIVNFWGKANNGSTERNREDAAKLFMSIIDYLELGKYVIGRGNNSTRIEWITDIKERLQKIIDESDSQDAFIGSDEQGANVVDENAEDRYIDASEKKTIANVNANDKREDKSNYTKVDIIRSPRITISVDMSEWSEEKIKYFFKYVYGQFEEE